MTAVLSKLRVGGESPAGDVDLASPASERRRVRIRRLSAGLVLVTVAAVLGWLAFQARGETIEVWTAAVELDPGLTRAQWSRQQICSSKQWTSTRSSALSRPRSIWWAGRCGSVCQLVRRSRRLICLHPATSWQQRIPLRSGWSSTLGRRRLVWNLMTC